MGSAARLERAEIPRTRNAHPASPPPLPPPSKHLKSSMKTIARSGALRATAGGVLVVLLLLGSSTKTALAFSSESEGAVEVKKVEVSTAADLAQVAKDISPDGKLKGIDLKISGDDLTDLTPLAGLKSVPGLSISDTDKLESLDALENLENVDLSLVIEDNEKLKSASLPKLSNVGMSLTIEDNEALASISLPELGSVGMDFEIEENEALKEVAAKVGSVDERGNRGQRHGDLAGGPVPRKRRHEPHDRSGGAGIPGWLAGGQRRNGFYYRCSQSHGGSSKLAG